MIGVSATRIPLRGFIVGEEMPDTVGSNGTHHHDCKPTSIFELFLLCIRDSIWL